MFHACQRDARIAFPDMVKGYLCPHRCRLSDDQRAVVLGRTGGKYEIAAIAAALRSCSPEYRVPKLSRRSHGVFVSEMPYEMEEEEEERDEEDSGDDLDDVEKFLNEDDESDMVLEEDEVREPPSLPPPPPNWPTKGSASCGGGDGSGGGEPSMECT